MCAASLLLLHASGSEDFASIARANDHLEAWKQILPSWRWRRAKYQTMLLIPKAHKSNELIEHKAISTA